MNAKTLAACVAALLLAAWPAGSAAAPELKYVVIVSRHGVRAPTWDNARLNAYSAEPWPEWDVPPGNLTPHGRKLIGILGTYYREWLAAKRLLRTAGCGDAARVQIRADRDQRTVETGRAFAETLLPGCPLDVQTQAGDQPDRLFSGAGTPDPGLMLAAVRERLGRDPQRWIAAHRAALDTLQSIVGAQLGPASEIAVKPTGRSIELAGPLAIGSTFSENLLLEYANGMDGAALGWGRMTPEELYRVLEVHTVYADLMRRTAYLARARGSNLLSHVVQSLEQAASGELTAGALGRPGDILLLLVGHDTNLSNLSGMLGLSWKLAGYQPDDTPPGGALIFSLWREPGTGRYSLKLRYAAQTPDQMHRAECLSLATPPEGQDLPFGACSASGCDWETARQILRHAVDPAFVDALTADGPR